MKKAALLVDKQNDFVNPLGTLHVKGAEKTVFDTNFRLKYGGYDLVVASRDHHPRNHISFASRHGVPPFTLVDTSNGPQMTFSDHCVADTWGADIYSGVDTRPIKKFFYKGMDSEKEAYSPFSDTDLDSYLKSQNVTELEIFGDAFDYCVRAAALDAVKLGYDTYVVKYLCKSVDPINDEAVAHELEDAGVKII